MTDQCIRSTCAAQVVQHMLCEDSRTNRFMNPLLLHDVANLYNATCDLRTRGYVTFSL